MREINVPIESMEDLKASVLDQVVASSILLVIPAILISIYRSFTMKLGPAFDYSNFVRSILNLGLVLYLFFSGRTLPYRWRIRLFLTLLFFNALSVYATLGLLSMGGNFILIDCALAVVLANKKTAYLLAVGILLCIATLGFGVSLGWYKFTFSPQQYTEAASSWLNHFFGMILFLAIIIGVFDRMNAHFHRLIHDRQKAMDELILLNQGLEARVLERTRQLEESNKELESFSYSISHDLRAPLRRIKGFSQILQVDAKNGLSEEDQDVLKRIVGSTDHMDLLITSLLDYSRLVQHELARQTFDLSAMARSVAEELSGLDPSRKVVWVIQPNLHIHADPILMRTVMENLLGNAWKFTGKHPEARIEFGATGDEDARIYFVRDDGAGFDPLYQDKLFVHFRRLHSENEFEGTGIGLAGVKQIITRHGGRIWAVGAVEQGATFYFTQA